MVYLVSYIMMYILGYCLFVKLQLCMFQIMQTKSNINLLQHTDICQQWTGHVRYALCNRLHVHSVAITQSNCYNWQTFPSAWKIQCRMHSRLPKSEMLPPYQCHSKTENH